MTASRVDSVPCPKCGAKPGSHCVTKAGRERIDYPHLARKKEWDRVRSMTATEVVAALTGMTPPHPELLAEGEWGGAR